MDYDAIARRVLERLQRSPGDGDRRDHLSLATWEWPQGVAMYAMMKVYLATGDPARLDAIRAWYDGHLRRGLPPKNINTAAPMLALALLWEHTREPRYLSPIAEWADWAMNALPRTEEGGFQHVTADSENRQQLWDDTLYMTVLFLYRAGVALDRPEWREEAKYQFLLHIKYLHDPATGLWRHGWCFEGRHPFAGALWARGNGWFTAGAADFVQWLPEDDPARRLVLETWREQCAALVRCQDDSGLWHTLLDREDSYLETSASAAIAYGLLKGARLGLLDADCAAAGRRALAGVLDKVAPDGTVTGVSYGTPMGRDLDFYRRVPLRPTAYGQGLVYLMLTEAV